MKLLFVEVEGFRGIRGRVRVPFQSGFTVLTGRNGSGKSSICDAIEFALTGNIQRLAADREKGEDITDYFWWRGSPSASSKFVRLGLVDNTGKEVVIERGPGDKLSFPEEVHDLLCNKL